MCRLFEIDYLKCIVMLPIIDACFVGYLFKRNDEMARQSTFAYMNEFKYLIWLVNLYRHIYYLLRFSESF